jgi:hypothetical protein
VKIYVVALKALRKKERWLDETQFTTKIGGKVSLGPNYFVFVKFSFPGTHSDALLYPNSAFSPPKKNRMTLRITLQSQFSKKLKSWRERSVLLRFSKQGRLTILLDSVIFKELEPMIL